MPRALLGSILLSLVLVACGGSRPAPETSGAFAAHADAICGSVLESAEKLVRPIKTRAQLLQFIERFKPLASRLASELGRLRPPAAEVSAFRAYLSAVRTVAAAAGELLAAVRSNDIPAARAAFATLTSETADRAAAAAGLAQCAGTVGGEESICPIAVSDHSRSSHAAYGCCELDCLVGRRSPGMDHDAASAYRRAGRRSGLQPAAGAFGDPAAAGAVTASLPSAPMARREPAVRAF